MKKLAALAAVLCFTSTALIAEPTVRRSIFDPTAGPNQYEVQFPAELGGATIFMPIVGGSFDLETDRDAGTARLLSWTQDVDAIDIFGKSTGPITITLQPGTESTGTFDPNLDQFSVTGTFLISFDDTELQEFGFFSPIALEGNESGNIYGVGAIGTIRMYLEGGGSVAGSGFTYTCHTSARFEYTLLEGQAQPGDLNHDKDLDVSDPISLLGGLFLGTAPECPEAGDVNADSTIDVSDAVYLLAFLFQGGPAPPAAPVTCGVDDV
ncbi:MAG TPA: hypothetical protein VMT52_08470 [Planctomycetota bacterium]|nr:hypothetical protein [Planctomycetota bacterium]